MNQKTVNTKSLDIVSELLTSFPFLLSILQLTKWLLVFVCRICLNSFVYGFYCSLDSLIGVMGDLPIERCTPDVKPFTWICLDFLGPILVKAMVNKRAYMKVWPLIFVCQATTAVHLEVAHDYGTDAFLLQFHRYAAIRDYPRKVVSDKGSQLTSADNAIAWTAKEDH